MPHSALTLQCDVTAQPAVEFKWSQYDGGGQKVDGGDGVEVQRVIQDDGEVQIVQEYRLANIIDDTTVHCDTSNVFGTSRRTFVVRVKQGEYIRRS
jgi:hypothetical protein